MFDIFFGGHNFSRFLAPLLNGLSQVPPIDRFTSRQQLEQLEAQICPDSSLLFLLTAAVAAADHLKAMHSAKLSCFASENRRSDLVSPDCGHFSANTETSLQTSWEKDITLEKPWCDSFLTLLVKRVCADDPAGPCLHLATAFCCHLLRPPDASYRNVHHLLHCNMCHYQLYSR